MHVPEQVIRRLPGFFSLIDGELYIDFTDNTHEAARLLFQAVLGRKKEKDIR